MIWLREKVGCFSTKGTYGVLCEFVLQLIHDWVTSKSFIVRWKDINTWCDYCKFQSEDSLHIFRYCDYALKVWRKVVKPSMMLEFFNGGLDTWVRNNIRKEKKNFGINMYHKWKTFWAMSVWKMCLWFLRDEMSQIQFFKYYLISI